MSNYADPQGLYADVHAAGGMSKYAWEDDPRRLAFTLARYKHVAKMLEGYHSVLEIGCADGFGSRIVRQHVGGLMAVDLDPQSIKEARRNASPRWPIDFQVRDIEREAYFGHFDAVYCLDVLEHIDPAREAGFLQAMRSLCDVAIIGTPTLESQAHASQLSKAGHVNCKTGPELRKTLYDHWEHVFLFSMHDEVIGTGFLPMAHYLLALCVGK